MEKVSNRGGCSTERYLLNLNRLDSEMLQISVGFAKLKQTIL